MRRPWMKTRSVKPGQTWGPVSAPAQAQNIESVLKGAGVTIASIAIIVSGYKIIFQGARFEDVSKILIGGLLIGGATSLAGWLIGAAA